jgi:hypothetical protein
VNEAVPHPSYRTPLNLRTRCAELLSQILHGLADTSKLRTKVRRSVSSAAKRSKLQTLTLIEQVFNFYENMAQIVTRLEGHPLPRPGCAAR